MIDELHKHPGHMYVKYLIYFNIKFQFHNKSILL